MKQRKYNMGLVVKGKQTDFVNLQIRKITIPLTRLILKYTNISPNQVSYVGLVFTILTLLFFIQGGYWNFIFGSIFLFLVSIADHLDGKMARALNKPSLYGAWLDGMMDIVFLPLLMVSISIGLKSYLLGMFASICYAIEFMVAYKWKADFSNHLNKDEVHTVKKESRLRFLYGGHTAYHLIPLACIFNKPILILWFFAIFGNLFWIIMLFMQYRVVRKYAK